jgi:hypothetical protein
LWLRACSRRGPGDVSALVIHGQEDARSSDAIEFRDDLDFGPNVQRIGDHLKEQDKKLSAMQEDIAPQPAGITARQLPGQYGRRRAP